MTEFLLGGLAAVGAGCFSNPLEVVKIRMQLQGELQKSGYKIHYRNVFHATYTIALRDGLLALQKGLVPALWYQFIMNGTRLGTYHLVTNAGLTRNKKGQVQPLKAVLFGAFSGALGAAAASPFYLVKTQLQAKANDSTIAVGTQHNIKNMSSTLKDIFKNHGVSGLWRGTSSQVARMVVSSAIQLSFFETILELIRSKKWFPERSWMNAFLASSISGLFVTIGMAPPDLIATRIYNQKVDSKGVGLVYKSLFDCARQIYAQEGLLAFFKGWTANWFRVGPHLVLLFTFWDQLKYLNYIVQEKRNKPQDSFI